jgi:hypothetical protein
VSYPSQNLLAAAAVRTNALTGVDAAALETTYATRPLASSNFQSSIFPFTAYIDSLVQAQGKLAEAIAKSSDRVHRAYLLSETSALSSGDNLPSVDSAGAPIIGNFGGARDGSSGVALTRMPVATIRNRLLATNIFLAPAYQFALTPSQILHTRTTAILDCCVWDADDQTAIYVANGDFTLADSLAEAVICGACAMLMRDDEFVEQSTRWAQYFASTLETFPPATMEAQAA